MFNPFDPFGPLGEFGTIADKINDLKEKFDLDYEEPSLPNLPTKVIDGGVFWDTLDEIPGYRLQQHRGTRHARIINDENIRVAWGSLEQMEDRLRSLRCPWKPCKKGDILAISRLAGVYSHFAVYIGKGKVIHYAAPNGDFGGTPTIHKADFSNFIRKESSFDILSFPDDHTKPTRNSSTGSMACLSGGAIIDFQSVLSSVFSSRTKENYHLYSAEETIERAKSRLGESNYSLVTNNCEHFALWCKTGISESYQVKEVLSVITAINVPIIL